MVEMDKIKFEKLEPKTVEEFSNIVMKNIEKTCGLPKELLELQPVRFPEPKGFVRGEIVNSIANYHFYDDRISTLSYTYNLMILFQTMRRSHASTSIMLKRIKQQDRILGFILENSMYGACIPFTIEGPVYSNSDIYNTLMLYENIERRRRQEYREEMFKYRIAFILTLMQIYHTDEPFLLLLIKQHTDWKYID